MQCKVNAVFSVPQLYLCAGVYAVTRIGHEPEFPVAFIVKIGKKWSQHEYFHYKMWEEITSPFPNIN